MRDSDTYLAIIDEGREEQVKEDILHLATKRFGSADEPDHNPLERHHGPGNACGDCLTASSMRPAGTISSTPHDSGNGPPLA